MGIRAELERKEAERIQMIGDLDDWVAVFAENELFEEKKRLDKILASMTEDELAKIKEEQTVKKYEIDAPKMAYLEKLFGDIKRKGIPIICVLTPNYQGNLNLYNYKEGLQLCEKYDIPVVNHIYYEGISQNAQYFYDISHLNDKGAKYYTYILCGEIKNY